jgi:hypothetical protein
MYNGADSFYPRVIYEEPDFTSYLQGSENDRVVTIAVLIALIKYICLHELCYSSSFISIDFHEQNVNIEISCMTL